jgi:cbb3-type cytochrome oxidase subunit 3
VSRTLRNIAIIALLAVPVAFLPGGGRAADAVLALLSMAFLAVLAFALRQVYRENRLTFDSLPDDQRAVLLGSVGILALMVAGADEMLGGGGFGAVLWVMLVACSVIAIIGVWTRAHSY